MHTQSKRNRWPGMAGAAVVASAAMMGAAFAFTTAPSTASAQPANGAPGSVPVSTLAPNISSSSLSQIQARAAQAITNRVNSLAAEIKVVQGDSSFLGSSDGTTLVNDMQTDTTDLQALGNTIAGDTTVSQALKDYRSIFTTYRVYWFMLPDARLVIHTDRNVNLAIPAVQRDVTTLLGEVNSSTPARVTTLLNNAQGLLTKATTALSGLSTELLGYTAMDWNANPRLFATPTAAVNHADWDVAVARFDVARARLLLNHRGRSAETTTTTTTVG